MEPFAYERATDPVAAVTRVASDGTATFLAGGTTLLDLMKLGVERPATLVDVTRLPLATIVVNDQGARIGALARNSDVAYHPEIRARYPAVAESILSGATPQLRNMATIGGNLLQRTRCWYFRDVHARCNKRVPAAGCDALEGVNRTHALLGTSDLCIAAHPSDLCTVLAAFDAVVRTRGPRGERAIPFAELYIAYGDDPAKEHVLDPGELITAVELPPTPFFARSRYLKVRDRESYEFALASSAVALEIEDGVVRQARVGLGGVATRPWRSHEAERTLVGARAERPAFVAAAEAALAGARPRRHNGFKVPLAKATLVRALEVVAAAERPDLGS
jgi:xanthine dehydrogenase YagS FAD-binding subunit